MRFTGSIWSVSVRLYDNDGGAKKWVLKLPIGKGADC
jgi:hypothetical protein